jgi:hypothetical protein
VLVVLDHRDPMQTPSSKVDPALHSLNRLIGAWTTEATHPATPGIVVHGVAEISWLEGQRFLIHRARTDHPDFPDSISIIGIMDRDRAEDPQNTGFKSEAPSLRMHYFDSRGVFRVYDASIDDVAWRLERLAPRFSQRFTGTFADDGRTIEGLWTMCEDDVSWNDDLQITYRRSK